MPLHTGYHGLISPLSYSLLAKDGSTVRSKFSYYVPRTLNRTVPVYRTSVQFLKRTVPTYRTCTISDSDGHSGAVHLLRYFFGSGSGSAAAFFRHQRQAVAPLFF